MRKRILIFLLAALFVLSGCSRQVVSVLSDNGETASEIISQSISSDASSDSSEASSYGSSSLPISSRAAKSTASSKASASVSSNRSGIVAAPTVAEEKDTPLPTPEVETTTTPVTQVQTTTHRNYPIVLLRLCSAQHRRKSTIQPIKHCGTGNNQSHQSVRGELHPRRCSEGAGLLYR